MVEDYFAGVAGLEFLRALAALYDGENFAVVRARLAIAFKVGLRELPVGGIGRLLGCTFPGGASTSLLLLHCPVETHLIKLDSLIAGRVLNEVKRHPECVVKPKREPSVIGWFFTNLS